MRTINILACKTVTMLEKGGRERDADVLVKNVKLRIIHHTNVDSNVKSRG
jgi:hypothetical protein